MNAYCLLFVKVEDGEKTCDRVLKYSGMNVGITKYYFKIYILY